MVEWGERSLGAFTLFSAGGGPRAACGEGSTRKGAPVVGTGREPGGADTAGRGRILCGTCAWADHQNFYPPGLKPTERLAFYARHFPVVEVDSTFYHPQPARNFQLWAGRTPAGFVFDVKAYRAMTRHDRQPRPGDEDVAEVFARFRESLRPLEQSGKLRAVLFQFPPWFTCTPENRGYLEWVRETYDTLLLAVEFRHRSWWQAAQRQETLDFLRSNALVNVICDEPQVGSGTVPAVVEVTNPRLAVVRFHGRNAAAWYKKGLANSGERFNYLYSRQELQPWAEAALRLAAEAQEVHLLMNNNFGDYAVRNARDLLEVLQELR